MTDEYRQQPKSALDEQAGEPAEATGAAVDARRQRHGALTQDERAARDVPPVPPSDAEAAQDEQDHQLETGEENPV